MAVSSTEWNDFQAFATQRISNGATGSLAELVAEWEAKRRHAASVEALRESHADAEYGDVLSAAEVFADVRRSLGVSE